MPIIFFIRGLPGAGKSTLARSLRSTLGPFEADDYFLEFRVSLLTPSPVSYREEGGQF